MQFVSEMVFSLRNVLFLAFLFSIFYVSANPYCVQFYSPSEHAQKQFLIVSLEKRLDAYFGPRWANPRHLTDVDAAKIFFEKFKEKGTLVDFKFFDLFLSVLESTSGTYELRTQSFYIDTWMGYRPKSNFFQERHWDWHIIDGYFFNAPLPVSIMKETDFKYLNHVLATAKKMGRVTLREVLQRANHEWVLQTIPKNSELGQQYLNFVGDKSYQTLFSEFKAKVNQWVGSARTNEEREIRKQATDQPMKKYKVSNSALDLLIINKYFDLLLKFGVADKPFPHEKIIVWMQLTHWNVYEMALPYPSMRYMNDFLFQNSHDIVAKQFLLKILNTLETFDVAHYGDGSSFYFKFLDARWKVENEMEPRPAPEPYQTDLHIFSKRISDDLEASVYDETVVSWNSVLGRPQANVVDSRKLANSGISTVAGNSQLSMNVKQYFDQLRNRKTFKEEEITHDENLELNASLENTTYLSFTRSTSDRMLTLIRIFDGTNEPTYIEREFPHISFPRGENGEKVLELGRLFAKDEVEAQSVWPIMAQVAEYLKMANISGDVYFDCSHVAMRYYRSLGAQTVYLPSQLKTDSGKTPLWVMKFSVADIIRIFSAPKYQSVKLKK